MNVRGISGLVFVLALPFTSLDAQDRVPESPAEISLSFAPVVREAAPAVVNIYAKVVRPGRPSLFQDDPFFSDFFRNFGQSRPRVQNSLGSGVILTERGIVVSNYHVVGRATDIRVVLSDRREFSARVLLGDEESDLAILQLENGDGLPFLELRDSDRVEVGELVLAIGNPFGVGQTVSSGIVSGLARTSSAAGNSRGYFIQTDAPINPGNSGGALVDIFGRLIGINTSILSRSGGSNGIGFAIPANLVAQFVEQAERGAVRFERPWAGIVGQVVASDLAESLGMEIPRGLLISDIHPASPFADRGFEIGDVITHVDGLEVNSTSELIFRMSVTGIGDDVRITRLRGRAMDDIEVVMITPPNVPPSDVFTLGNRDLLPGLQVARINPMRIEEFQLPFSAEGVLVIEVGRIAARVGLKRGDVIFGLNGQRIETSDDLVQALARSGQHVQIELLRHNRRVVLRFWT